MRIPQPFYRTKLKCWYLKLGKKFIRLSPDRDEAHTKYHALMANRQPAATAADGTVASIIAQYLAWAERQCELGEMKPLTYRWYKRFLDSFVRFIDQHHAGLTIANLKTCHVKDWRDEVYRGKKGKSGAAGKRGAVVAVKRALNWAADDREIIPANPIKKIKAGKQTSRKVYIEPEDWARILAAVDDSDPFKDILLILKATGCRPAEARSVECRHVDLEKKEWEFAPHEWKCGKKTGLPRIVPLNETALDLTRRAVLRAGHEGYLFRNRKGQPFTGNWIGSKCRRLGEKLGIKDFCAYAIRHTWISDAITRGVDACTIADFCGTSAEMVTEVYCRVKQMPAHKRAALALATGETPVAKAVTA